MVVSTKGISLKKGFGYFTGEDFKCQDMEFFSQDRKRTILMWLRDYVARVEYNFFQVSLDNFGCPVPSILELSVPCMLLYLSDCALQFLWISKAKYNYFLSYFHF